MKRLTLVSLLLLGLTVTTVAAADPAGAARLLARPEMQTPAPSGRIVLKLDPAAGLTMADDGLAGRAEPASRLHRLLADLAPGARLERRIGLPAAATAALAERAASRGVGRVPDLNLWAHLDAGTRDRTRLAELVARLAADPAVVTAFAEPVAVPAALGFDAFTGATPPVPAPLAAPALPTPSFVSLQGYLDPAPVGIGALSVAANPGARGAGLKVIDIEGGWLWTHEDLPAPFFTAGTQIPDLSWRNHGTAVLGEIRGVDNAYGVRGIVPDCAVGGSSIGDQSLPGAIAGAVAVLAAGDAILIELHAPGPNGNGEGQFGYVAMEYWQDNFEAIALATAAGIIVCEAAGNGQQNLDDPVYAGLFDRTLRDSGAIVIGATDGSSLTPAWFTNHGSRVDSNGWGFNVVTCAYGDLQGGDETEWYTASFSGTSSASPIVTGAAASLQGMIDAWYGYRIDGRLARHILNVTGTPVSGPQLIGTRPDLVAAWALAAQGIGVVSGTVTQAGSGAPLAGVHVTAEPTGAFAVTDSDGRYELVLLAGAYTLSFREDFHYPLTVDVVIGDDPVIRDVSLPLLPLVTVDGLVTAESGEPLAGVVIRTEGAPVVDVVSGPDGSFTLGSIPAGRDLTLIAGLKPGYGGAARAVTLPLAPVTVHVTLILSPADFSFESGPQGFTTSGLWQRGNPQQTGAGPQQAFDGSFCWGVGMDGQGYDDLTTGTLASPVFAATEFVLFENLYLSFHYWLSTESGFDGLQVETGDGTLLTPVEGYSDASLSGLDYEPGWSGESGGWRTAVFDVREFIGQAWQFRLVFGSDQSVTGDGVFVDGFTLAEHPEIATPVLDLPPPAATVATLSAHPNPFNPQTSIGWAMPRAGRVDLRIYDPRGRLVADLLQAAPVGATGQVTWTGEALDGSPAASGVYLIRLRTDDGLTATRRVVLAK
jgi:hypothetical protein